MLVPLLYFIYVVLRQNSALQSHEVFSASAVCLRVLGLRDPSRNVAGPGVASFGLLRGGCDLPATPSVVTTNDSVCLSFAELVQADGYYFVTPRDGAAALDPVKWKMEATQNGSGWATVGASTWRWNDDGSVALYPNLPFPTPESRSTQVVFRSHSPP